MIDKEKALSVAKSLIELEHSILDTKYSASHHKVAIKFKEHVIELCGDEEKYIKYLNEKIMLNNSEYKQIYACFTEELSKRKTRTAEKFNSLEQLIISEQNKKNHEE